MRMLGNAKKSGFWIKREGMCSGYGKDGPGRALATKGCWTDLDDWDSWVGKQVEGRLSWMAYIDFPGCGAQ